MASTSSDHRRHPAAPQFDWQEGIHQAVDIGFSVADLLGGLFGDATHKHALARHADDSEAGVFLTTAPSSTGSQPLLQLSMTQNATSSLFAVVNQATTQLPLNGSAPANAGPLYAQPMLLTPTTSSQSLTDLGSYSQGLFTASLVDGSNPGAVVPLCGLTARGSLLGAQGVPLLSAPPSGGNPPTPLVTFNMDPADPQQSTNGSITVVNNHPSETVWPSFTVMTGAPNQSFSVSSPVNGIPPGGQETLAFPIPLTAGTTIQQLNAVLSGAARAVTEL